VAVVDLELHQLELRYALLRIADGERRRRLAASIAEVGQQTPVVVVAASSAEGYVLIDGYARVAARKSLRHDVVQAVVWPISEAEALIERHHLATKGSVLEEAWLLCHLRQAEGHSLDELGRRFLRSKSWVSRRVALATQMPGTLAERVRAGVIAPQAAMKYLVPLARANGRQCKQLVEALGNERLSVRAVEKLYLGWRQADKTGRARIAAAPLLYLRALEETGELDDETAALVKDLEMVGAICRRARRHVKSVATDYARTHVDAAWQATTRAFAHLKQAMEEVHDRSGDTHGDPASP
jgi:ParB family chromosome partitioning protein